MSVKLVLFDCDGVLVDSEPVAGDIASAALTELGWRLSPQECIDQFTGMSLPDILPLVRAEVGDVPDSWLKSLAGRLLVALSENLEPMEGAIAMLQVLDTMGVPWRVASNSNRREMAAKFAVTGLAPLVADRFHSSEDVARGKPAPDVFLAAAGAVSPADCVVIEDSIPGITAALAAGMFCVGFAPRHPERLSAAGAHQVIGRLAYLPSLLRGRME